MNLEPHCDIEQASTNGKTGQRAGGAAVIANRVVSKQVALDVGRAHLLQPKRAKTSAGELPDKLEIAVRCGFAPTPSPSHAAMETVRVRCAPRHRVSSQSCSCTSRRRRLWLKALGACQPGRLQKPESLCATVEAPAISSCLQARLALASQQNLSLLGKDVVCSSCLLAFPNRTDALFISPLAVDVR